MRWRAFPLHPEVPAQGLELRDLFADYPMDIETISAQMQQAALRFGLPFVRQDRIYNTRAAQELSLWAESQGKGADFHAAAFQAYFAFGKNLADSQVLIDLAAAIGLPSSGAAAVLAERRFRLEVEAHWDLARRKGISAVPTLSAGSEKLVGAQPYEAMVKFVEGIVGNAASS